MHSRPPLEYVRQIPAYDLIELTADCIIASVQKGHLEFALGRVADRLPMEDFSLLKSQLDRTTGLVKTMVNRRIDWGAWPVTDTGPALKAAIEEHIRAATLSPITDHMRLVGVMRVLEQYEEHYRD